MSPKVAMKVYVVEPQGSGGMIHYAYQLCTAVNQSITETALVTSKKYELEGFPHPFQVIKFMDLWRRNEPVPAAGIKNGPSRFWWMVYRNLRRAVRGTRLFVEWARLTTFLLRVRPDVTQFGSLEFPFIAIFLRILKSQGLVLTQICHEFESREQAKNILTRINHSLLVNIFSSFAAIFFHSPSNLERFHELYPQIPTDRLHTISMGNGSIFPEADDKEAVKTQLRTRYGLTAENKVVLFFGNVTPSKGIPDLLTAFSQVREHNPHARLIIAGMPLKYIDPNSLFEMSIQLGIQAETFFDPRYIPLEEVRPLLELADVVVFPYTSSTQSASIQAAYAAGKPVIATRVGGLADVVEDGVSGFLVDPCAPAQLAEAILEIFNDSSRAEKMGQAARKYSETTFAWSPIAENIISVYQGVLANIH